MSFIRQDVPKHRNFAANRGCLLDQGFTPNHSTGINDSQVPLIMVETLAQLLLKFDELITSPGSSGHDPCDSAF